MEATYEKARFEPMEEIVKTESSPAASPQPQKIDGPPPPASKSPLNAIPTTEAGDTPDSGAAGSKPKKKGTAATKKAPKRARAGGNKNSIKKTKTTGSVNDGPDENMDDASDDAESDHGPYCLCRGPDDHRWMICCEICEDWFHGECINLSKDIGESLVEKFVCPNCTKGKLTTLYKKACALGACRKPARITQGEPSVFCSNDHAHMWWERMVSRLPKGKAKAGLNDQLTQDEFMALLNSGLASVDGDGGLKLARIPFQDELPQMGGDADGQEDGFSKLLTKEERAFLDQAASARYHLAQETVLCNHMLEFLEFAQKRRRVVIDANRFGEDICGYDFRLDTISARDAFAAILKSPEGEKVLETQKLDAPPKPADDDEDDIARGLCERKRCKVHGGWHKMLSLGIKHQMREMAGQAAEVAEEERVLREAAAERWGRKKAESNWVEVIDS